MGIMKRKLLSTKPLRNLMMARLAQWRMSPNVPFYPTFILISPSKKCKKMFSFQDIIIHNLVFLCKTRNIYCIILYLFHFVNETYQIQSKPFSFLRVFMLHKLCVWDIKYNMSEFIWPIHSLPLLPWFLVFTIKNIEWRRWRRSIYWSFFINRSTRTSKRYFLGNQLGRFLHHIL